MLTFATAGWGGAAAEVATSSGAPGSGASRRPFATTMESPESLPGYNVYRPERLGATGARLPVIVWANGGCVRYDVVWAPLLEAWAAAGFFVLSIATPADADPRSAGSSTIDDQAKAIDWAIDQNKRGVGPYSRHLDVHRIVAAGNSCGGITALGLAAEDDRVSTVFVLSGSSIGPGASREAAAAIMEKIEAPVGFVVGGAEDIASAQADQDYDVQPAGVPGYVAHRAEGDHPAVSTTESILVDEVAEISVNWFDLALFGDAAARKALLHDPCDCPPDLWTVRAKHLGKLVEK